VPRFRPALVPTLFVATALFILVQLGLWQLRRHNESLALRETVEARLNGPALTRVPESVDAGQWHQARLQGRWRGKPALITGRFEFGEPGFDLAQLLETAEGQLVLVNRGWIPQEGWADHLARVGEPAGPVEVEGLLIPLGGDPAQRPLSPNANSPERWPNASGGLGCMPARDVPYRAIAAQLGGTKAIPLVVVAGPSLQRPEEKRRDPLPAGGFIARPKEIPHLNYAGQWFLIAGTLLSLWVWAGLRRGRLDPPA
jgi:cytochrome oxidase assembly protein ShyY1